MKKKNKGFTLLLAIITTSILLVVSFVVINIATKQLFIGDANQQSQYAFYNADTGSECAIYWDLQKTGNPSPFDSTTPFPYSPVPRCNNQNIVFITSTPPPVVSGYSTSTFKYDLTRGCVQVDVVKNIATKGTKINSHGYNNCTASAQRRYERAIEINY